LNSFQLNLTPIVELKFILESIKLNSNTLNGFQFHIRMNCCLSLWQHSKTFLVSQWYLLFPCFFYVFNLGANKEDLLHVTHYIISSLPFGWNSILSRLFQHFMSLIYEHVMNFLCLGMHFFFLSLWFALTWNVTHQLMFTSLKVYYVKKMIKKINGPKKGKMYYFPQCSSYVLRKTLVKKYLGINPCILLQGCFKWHGYSSFKREEKNLNI